MIEVLKCPRCLDEELLRKVGYAVCAGCDFMTILIDNEPDRPETRGELSPGVDIP